MKPAWPEVPSPLPEHIGRITDGAFLFRQGREDGAYEFAYGFGYTDVIARGLWFETQEAARMAWDMRPAEASGNTPAGFKRVVSVGLEKVFAEAYK